jgi:putative ABC transport system permease protein
LTGSGEPARLQGTVVSANLFPLLGVSPILGRGFAENEDKPSENGRVVILSQDLFQRRFNANPALLNQPITLTAQSTP